MTVRKGSLLQRVENRFLQAHGTVFGNAHLHRDFVGLQESDSPDFFAKDVRVLADFADGVLPKFHPQLFRGTARDVVIVQEQKCFSAVAVFLPVGEEFFDLLRRESFNFLSAETVRLVVENVLQFIAEGIDNGLRGLGANSREKPAA